MRTGRAALHLAGWLAGVVAVSGAPAALGQGNVAVKLKEVVDDRFSKGMLTGHLRVELVLDGEGAEGVKAARFLPKEAKDDTGASLLPKEKKEPGFDKLDQQKNFRVDLESPARKAKSLRLTGKVELYVPGRDPNAIVKVPGALGLKDRPIKSPGLKSAKVEVTLLSLKAYAEEKKKQKIDDSKTAEIRAEGKKRGVSEKEIDAMIELAKAFQEMGDSSLTDDAVILSGKLAEMEKIVEVTLQKADGTEISIGEQSASSDGKTKTMVLKPRETPADAVLVFTLLTDKAKVSIPVDLKEVTLP